MKKEILVYTESFFTQNQRKDHSCCGQVGNNRRLCWVDATAVRIASLCKIQSASTGVGIFSPQSPEPHFDFKMATAA